MFTIPLLETELFPSIKVFPQLAISFSFRLHSKRRDGVKEYVIIDNLLRRQLIPEKRAFLLDELSKVYEKRRGGDRRSENFKKVIMTSLKDGGDAKPQKEDVNLKTAKIANVSSNTVQRARAYVRAVEKKPKKHITLHLFLNGKRNRFAIGGPYHVSNASISLF